MAPPKPCCDIGELEGELHEVNGRVHALDAALKEQREDTRDWQDRMEGKLDAILGLKSRVEDHTQRVRRLEDERTTRKGWADRVAWIWLGVTGLAAAAVAGWQLFHK